LLTAHLRDWLGPLATHLLDTPERQLGPNTEFRFARGWIDRVQIGEVSGPLVEAFCRAPLLRLLRELVIDRCEYDEPWLEQLAQAPCLGNVRVFQLGPQERCFIQGAQAVAFVQKMPRLEDLRLCAHNVNSPE